MGFEVPDSLGSAHDSIHATLKRAMAEPGRIGEAARLLAQVATGEGKLEYVALAGEWSAHAQLEEDVLYPAALVIGAFARRLGGA